VLADQAKPALATVARDATGCLVVATEPYATGLLPGQRPLDAGRHGPELRGHVSPTIRTTAIRTCIQASRRWYASSAKGRVGSIPFHGMPITCECWPATAICCLIPPDASGNTLPGGSAHVHHDDDAGHDQWTASSIGRAGASIGMCSAMDYGGDNSVCIPDANGYYQCLRPRRTITSGGGDHNKALGEAPHRAGGRRWAGDVAGPNIILQGTWLRRQPLLRRRSEHARRGRHTDFTGRHRRDTRRTARRVSPTCGTRITIARSTTSNVFPGGMMMMMLVDST